MRQIYKTLIAATLTAAFFSMPMMGGGLIFIIFIQIIYIPFLALAYLTGPERRKLYVAKAIIWALASVAIFTTHFVRHVLNRYHANEITYSINTFISANKRCPHNLEEIGLSKESIRKHLPMFGYSCSESDGRPLLYYSVGYMPYAMYKYDFDKQKWHRWD
ncbi:MAG: hypothetical protein FWF20_10880 [Betaproteobacteria bacterium]|nr:hypothetical protein [Betaproteobacteria bacterium]